MFAISVERKKVIRSFVLPAYSEIPAVGLYLDQSAKYINECLEDIGCSLTNSMISNYVKKKLIANPVKKQYGRDQIADLIFIAICKNILSLEDIGKLFVIRDQHADVRKSYELFKQYFEEYLPKIYDNRDIALKDSSELNYLLKSLTTMAIRNIYLNELLSDPKTIEIA